VPAGVERPFVIVQLSDPHVGADWGGGDSVAMLAAAVRSVRSVVPRPDAVLVSGDLADHALDVEYEQVRELLAQLDSPIHVLPGNHDDRAVLRRNFDVFGNDGQPVQYAADLGPLRLVAVDSTRPGEARGELDADRLGWLQATLAEAPTTPTVVALHHAPLVTGIPGFDELGLPAADRGALATVLEAHPQVCRIVAGHLHRTISAELGGRGVLAVPSTYVQAELEFGAAEIQPAQEPSGFAVHTLVGGELVSHVQPVTEAG
jgi:3',5'-cyclic AMP phosphodiesterase CpdA